MQGVELFRSCQCKPEYDKTCTGTLKGTTLTPDLYIGMSADYCEITSSSEDSVTSTKTYKKCQCPDNFITCPEGTAAPDSPANGQFCVEVSASGSVTTKYIQEACLCVPLSPENEGYVAANLQDTNATKRDGANISASRLSASNQAALKQIFLQNCKHQNNGLVKSDGCGNLFYKCLIDPNTYMYYKDNCPEPYKLQGTSKTDTGWNGSLTLYPICDCNPNWYTQTKCNERASTEYKCQLSGDAHQDVKNRMICANINGATSNTLKLYGNSCVNNSGETVYEYCECNMNIFTYWQTGVSPRTSCIDGGSDDKINQTVWVCYFDSEASKNAACPQCKKRCSYGGVSSSKYHVSRSFESI